jgi:hypothetical protein
MVREVEPGRSRLERERLSIDGQDPDRVGLVGLLPPRRVPVAVTEHDGIALAEDVPMISIVAADKVYDGNTDATVTGRALNGTVENDNVSLVGGDATFADKHVGDGKTVTALGMAKVAKIYYEAQANLLTSANDYQDLHSNLRQACTNLTGTSGIRAFEHDETPGKAKKKKKKKKKKGTGSSRMNGIVGRSRVCS